MVLLAKLAEPDMPYVAALMRRDARLLAVPPHPEPRGVWPLRGGAA